MQDIFNMGSACSYKLFTITVQGFIHTIKTSNQIQGPFLLWLIIIMRTQNLLNTMFDIISYEGKGMSNNLPRTSGRGY
jgi:hypothetical protein